MRSAKAAFGAIVVGAWVIGGVASATSTTSAPKSYVITIENMQFNPPQIDRVVWVNKDFFAHTATADAKAFDSLAIAPNASWTYVAHRVGDYSYKCTFHPTMRGMLTVAP
jgi:plastocyanin